MTQEQARPRQKAVITVWRDFDHCREPERVRTNNHKRKLAEFACHLRGQSYFRAPHRVVTLNEWEIDAEAVELWARVRQLIARNHVAEGPKAMQPLFWYADLLEEIVPTHQNLAAARRDLVAAVGMRAALSRTDQESELQFD